MDRAVRAKNKRRDKKSCGAAGGLLCGVMSTGKAAFVRSPLNKPDFLNYK
jgi:hypothetical protein